MRGLGFTERGLTVIIFTGNAMVDLRFRVDEGLKSLSYRKCGMYNLGPLWGDLQEQGRQPEWWGAYVLWFPRSIDRTLQAGAGRIGHMVKQCSPGRHEEEKQP
jgi:hypothetical protein